MTSNLNRRDFLQFLGLSTLAASTLSSVGCQMLSQLKAQPFSPLNPSQKDDVLLAHGLNYQRLISWGEEIQSNTYFGFNNDYLAILPLENGENTQNYILWVNHESVDPLYVTGWKWNTPRTKQDVESEMLEVGGSLLHIRKNDTQWTVVKNSPYNRRLSARTPIPFSRGIKIQGKNLAIGTLANCAGGVTPWQTFLTCEENYDQFYGETFAQESVQKRQWKPVSKKDMRWYEINAFPPEHYGWVVEIQPRTGEAKKHVSLGRFSHESATVTLASDGRAVVYSGDDKENECLYKFISARPNDLSEGTLYVAQLETGTWIPLDWESQPLLKSRFQSQIEVLTYARDAAHLMGATPLDRPEDIEIHNITKSIYVTLTLNKKKSNFFGSILQIDEDHQDPLSLKFKSRTFLTGGPNSKISCPDNLAIDKNGNLWVTSDIPLEWLNKNQHQTFGNNGLFYIPLSGEFKGEVFQVASAPRSAEFTGPCFSPDGSTLFLSVQHPGEGSTSLESPLSHWPEGAPNKAKSSVITLQGDLLKNLLK